MKEKIILAALIAGLVFYGCTIDNNGAGCSIKFDGFNQLEIKSELVLQEDFPYNEFNIDFGSGNIILTGWSESFCKLEIKYLEYEKNDASIYIDNGKLETRSKSKKGVHISQVKGYLPNDVNLILDGGSGDISLDNFECSSAELDLGSGDIFVENSAIKKLLNDTGSGDVFLREINGSDMISADTGSGNVTLQNCHSIIMVQCDTGSGNVKLINCEIDKLFADTGSGDVIITASSILARIIDTGSGDIIERTDPETEDVL